MMKKVLTLLLVFVATSVLHSRALAQIDPNDVEDIEDFENCQGGFSTIMFSDVQSFGSSVTFTLSVDNGTKQTFTLNLDNLSPEDEQIIEQIEVANDLKNGDLINMISNSQLRSYLRFLGQELGCLGFGLSGSTMALTSDPNVNQSIKTLRAIAFSDRAQPRAAQPNSPRAQRREAAREDQAEEGGEEGQKALLSQVSSDVEYEFFELNNLGGENLAVRAGFAQTSANGRWSFGFNGIYNRLSFDGGNAFNNGFFNVFINRVTSSSLSRESIIGLNVSYLNFEGADNGFGIALHSVRRWYFGGGGVFTLGTMAQFAQVGDLSNGYINFAGLLGFPIGRRFALNIDALVLWNVVQLFDGEQQDLEDPILLNPGAYLMILFGDAFALNLGARTVLLIKDYTSYELALGASFRF